jgi:hypothetical protein
MATSEEWRAEFEGACADLDFSIRTMARCIRKLPAWPEVAAELRQLETDLRQLQAAADSLTDDEIETSDDEIETSDDDDIVEACARVEAAAPADPADPAKPTWLPTPRLNGARRGLPERLEDLSHIALDVLHENMADRNDAPNHVALGRMRTEAAKVVVVTKVRTDENSLRPKEANDLEGLLALVLRRKAELRAERDELEAEDEAL